MTHVLLDGTFPLEKLDDYTIAPGDPDPRGWDVFSSDATRIGRVHDLLVDVRAMKVRYLDIELDRDLVEEQGRHVLIPIGTARLDDNADRVTARIAASRTHGLPIYKEAGRVERDYEDALLSNLGMGSALAAGAGIDLDDYYGRPEYATDEFYGTRSTVSGHPLTRRRPGAGDLEMREPAVREPGVPERASGRINPSSDPQNQADGLHDMHTNGAEGPDAGSQ
jgi:photosynthetic reaction center H subunit